MKKVLWNYLSTWHKAPYMVSVYLKKCIDSKVYLAGCPYKVKVSRTKGTDDSEGPYHLLQEYYGHYIIQQGSFNGRDWYEKESDDSKAIWFCEDEQWIVGYKSKKGTCTGVFYTNDEDDCPNDPGYTWKYFVRAINKWVGAEKSMSIWAKS